MSHSTHSIDVESEYPGINKRSRSQVITTEKRGIDEIYDTPLQDRPRLVHKKQDGYKVRDPEYNFIPHANLPGHPQQLYLEPDPANFPEDACFSYEMLKFKSNGKTPIVRNLFPKGYEKFEIVSQQHHTVEPIYDEFGEPVLDEDGFETKNITPGAVEYNEPTLNIEIVYRQDIIDSYSPPEDEEKKDYPIN